MGFFHDLSRWPAFLEKIIQSAGEGLSTFAPEEIFKTPPIPPPSNMFKIGQTLEAADQHYPHLIYPAYIKDSKGNQILVRFIGYNQHGEYWCSYASREIFPIGWCESVGHILQLPGNLTEKTSPLIKGNESNNKLISFKRKLKHPHADINKNSPFKKCLEKKSHKCKKIEFI